MVKIGVIGLGSNGSLHFQNCMKMKNVEVLAIADKSKKSRNYAKRLGVKNRYEDYNELLIKENDIDAVVISLPNFLHFDSIIKSLENNKHVFIEKPLANTVEQCEIIKKKVEQSGQKLMIGHAMRFYDCIEKMKKKVDHGEIGNLEFFTAESIMNGPLAHGAVPHPVPDWWFNPQQVGGGVLLDLGYHLIDLYHYFMGDAELLFADFDHKYNMDVEDTATIILRGKNTKSATGFINVGWYQKSIFPDFDYRCIVHGNSGHVNTQNYMPNNMYLHAVKEGTYNFFRKVTLQKIKPLSYTYFYESFYKELEHFFNSIEKDEKTSVTVEDGLKIMRIIEKAYESMEKNKVD